MSNVLVLMQVLMTSAGHVRLRIINPGHLTQVLLFHLLR